MSETKSLSEALRVQYDDLQDAYREAKVGDNAPAMERLTKLISGLAKQIKDHEEHERVTLPKSEAFRLVNLMAGCLGRAVKQYVDDDELSTKILQHVHTELRLIAEGF